MKRIVAMVVVGLVALFVLPGLLAAAGAMTAEAAVVASQSAAAPQPPSESSVLSSNQSQALIERLQAADGAVQVAAHLETQRASYIGADAARPDFSGIATGLVGQPEAAARAFLAEYGALFGVSDVAALRVLKERTLDADAGGRTYVRYQQTINGIPVMAGELIVQVDANGRVWSASGEALPEDTAGGLPTTPVVTAETAAQTALAATVKYEGGAAANLTVSAPALWYYDSALLSAPGPVLTNLVWRVDVSAVDLAPIRELVLVDAITGKVTLHFNQVADAKNRVVYNNNNSRSAGLPGVGPKRTEGQGATGVNDVDKAYDYAGDTYDFYWSRFARDSIDGAGKQLISTVKFCPSDTSVGCPYANAFWNGNQMVYGDGYASGDDVVGHELSHAVTDFESSLFYYMQSGALNESLSDIFGEYIDLTNGKGNDAAGVRWQMGEDIPIGAIRNMANPGQFGDPNSMKSSNYKCDTSDNGGVHSNSGVSNRAAVLMTDGGSLNGKTVTGIGIEKSAQIWYRMATELITSGAEYQDVYNMLPQACTALAAGGVKGITSADCQQVRNAVEATQMNQEPTSCASPEAPVCPAGQTAATVYSEDFENQSLTLSRWTSGASMNPKPWYYPQTVNPYNMTDFYYASSGLYHLWGDDIDTYTDGWMEMKTGVTVPSSGNPYFRFRHAYGFEADFPAYYDGGVVEYSANGGAWTDAGPLFVNNGYKGKINGQSGNPLEGRNAFVDVSWGYGSSRLNLASLKGQSVKFRFRVGSDELVGGYGWFVDDVRLYSCITANRRVWMPRITR